jgi:hypothetical protein
VVRGLLDGLRRVVAYFSIYGISAPGALSFRPFWNCMKHVAANRSLFLDGLVMLGRTSTPSEGITGLAGLLISMSSELSVGDVLLALDGSVAARSMPCVSRGSCFCGVAWYVFAGEDGIAAGADSTVTSSLSDMASMAEAVQQSVGRRMGKGETERYSDRWVHHIGICT